MKENNTNEFENNQDAIKAADTADTNDSVDTVNDDASDSNYEQNDNWEFEAEAPTVSGSVIDGGDFEIDLPAEKPKKVEKSADKKSAEPKKKKDRDSANTTKFLLTAIFLVIVATVCGFFGNQYYNQPNISEKKNPGNVVMKIGDEEVTVGMYNFYYTQIVNQYTTYASSFGLDTTKDYSKQTVTDDDGKQTTWDKVFVDQTVSQLQRTLSLYQDAVKANMTLTSDQKDEIKSELKNYSDSAEKSNLSVDDYISQTCGDYCGYETLKAVYEQSYLAENYYYKTYVNTTATDDEIDAYFKKSGKNNCYNTGFSYVTVSYTTDDTSNYSTGEVRTKDEAQKLAKECQHKIASEKNLKAKTNRVHSLVKEVMKAEAESYFTSGYFDSIADATDYLVNASDRTAARSDTTLIDDAKNWLFSENTKVGDSKVFVDTENSFAYVLLKTSNEKLMEDEVFSVRHILIQAQSSDSSKGKISDDDIKTAKQTADKVLKMYNSGDKSEVSFALLAEDYSSDTSTTSSGKNGLFGGIYEGFKAGSSTGPFDKWVTDKSRKAGDVGEVYVNDYYTGYHLIYYKGKMPEWKYICKNAIVQDKQKTIIDDSMKSKTLVKYDRIMKKTKVAKPEKSSSDDSSSSSESTTAEQNTTEAQSTTEATTKSKSESTTK